MANNGTSFHHLYGKRVMNIGKFRIARVCFVKHRCPFNLIDTYVWYPLTHMLKVSYVLHRPHQWLQCLFMYMKPARQYCYEFLLQLQNYFWQYYLLQKFGAIRYHPIKKNRQFLRKILAVSKQQHTILITMS